MATNDTPGSNPENKDKLARGCWAEHEDGSLIFVKDIDENDRVIFEMYDFKNPAHPVYYPAALTLSQFHKQFSYDAKKVGSVHLKWTWHDKTPMPWDKVMRLIDQPSPVAANPQDTLSAAAQMAQSLQLRLAEVLEPETVYNHQGIDVRPAQKQARNLLGRLKNAMEAFRA